MGAVQGDRTVFLTHSCIGGRTAVAHPEPTKVFLKLSPEMAMLSAPFRCTHPSPPIPHFLLKQNHLQRALQEVTSRDESFMPDTSSYIWERVKLVLVWDWNYIMKRLHWKWVHGGIIKRHCSE